MIPSPVLDTLFLPTATKALATQVSEKRCAFWNAHTHSALAQFKDITLTQYFKPAFDALKQSGFTPEKTLTGTFDLILIALPKNRIESEYLIALALKHLEENGTLIAAADNKAGGMRIAKTFASFGVENVYAESKNKARVVWGEKPSKLPENAIAALKTGKPVIKNTFHTQPGIYGWDKIDRGSEILTRHIPEDLKGHGADFGCGYGYLAKFALKNCPKIKSLTCVDADARSLQCCELNLTKNSDFGSNTSKIVPSDREAAEGRKTSEAARPNEINYLWLDLTKPAPLKNLDFIIMNPPFHEGKKASASLGTAFIKTAHEALKKNGSLYMVANAHLPYEQTLKDTFFKVEKLHEGSGFKVYKAVK